MIRFPFCAEIFDRAFGKRIKAIDRMLIHQRKQLSEMNQDSLDYADVCELLEQEIENLTRTVASHRDALKVAYESLKDPNRRGIENLRAKISELDTEQQEIGFTMKKISDVIRRMKSGTRPHQITQLVRNIRGESRKRSNNQGS